jgi:hypothetical protein
MIAAEQERAEAARKAAQAVGGLSAVERERIRIVEDQTTQVIEAYLRGGDEAVGAVRSQIDEANAAWGELAAGLEERFGIEADLYRGNWEQILEEEAQFAKELVELERERWEQTVAAATSGFERILRAHASAGLPFTGRVEDYLFDLNRGPLTPTEALLMGQSGTPTVNVTVEAHLPSGVMAEMYIEGREGAQARGLE